MAVTYEHDLNSSQLEAVRTTEGAVLVIAGAGSGKTRTIVYRLAHLVEQGIPPESILLLTFTRRAAQEMLTRAGNLVDMDIGSSRGGTFHGFAYNILRRHGRALGFTESFTVMDRSDAENIIKQARDEMNLGKGDRSFPKKSTLLDLISKSRNKELSLETVLQKEAFHLLPYAQDLQLLADRYRKTKQSLMLMDYDDLLFYLETLLTEQPDLREYLQHAFQYVMVDEYQDTNLVQGRLVKLLSGEGGNVMVVGDDAQSIYAFRGANVQNILNFSREFPGAKIIKLEENYRSTQEILDLTNSILTQSVERYDKNLFTSRKDGPRPQLVRALSDHTQARLVMEKITELSRRYPLHEIAVLFRAGFQSFPLEVLLNRLTIPYQKFGGMRFTEAAHVKDVLAYLRLVVNPADLPAWQRAVAHIKGIGPKTCIKILEAITRGNQEYITGLGKKHPDLSELIMLLDRLRSSPKSPGEILGEVMEYYQPLLPLLYPDDYPKRMPGLEQLLQIVSGYGSLDTFLADLCLESPEASGRRLAEEDALVLSTIHSAKGLEWAAVLLIDLVEERFPSRHALSNADELEEERRLMYVACTRAKEVLYLFAPDTVYNRYQDLSESTVLSPFLSALPDNVYEEMREGYGGGLAAKHPSGKNGSSVPSQGTGPVHRGYCSHKIFGRGKIVEHIPPNKYRVNFPGMGLKVIIDDYLQMEEEGHGT